LGDSFAFAATEGFTWCAWVRYDTQWSWEGVQLLHLYAADTVAANLIDLRVLTHDGDGELPADSRRPGMQVAGAGAYTHFETSATAPGVIQETAGTWAHLAMTISPTGVIAFWRNGTTHAEWTHSGGVAANPSSVVYTYASMGGIYRGGYEGGTSPLHGVLRDVRLYARVVPGAELATIATGVLPTPTTAAPSAASSTTTTLLNAPYTIGLAEVCPTCSRNTHLNDALYFYEKVYLVCDTSSTPDTQEECFKIPGTACSSQLNVPYTTGLAGVCPTCSRKTHLNDALYFYEKMYLACDTSSTPDTQEECWQMECLPIVP
jgi:uncharacterized protein (DUF983 family)